jgi:hypothetical protein
VRPCVKRVGKGDLGSDWMGVSLGSLLGVGLVSWALFGW